MAGRRFRDHKESVLGRIYADMRPFRIYHGPSEAHRATGAIQSPATRYHYATPLGLRQAESRAGSRRDGDAVE
jgi:hypothetical protein